MPTSWLRYARLVPSLAIDSGRLRRLECFAHVLAAIAGGVIWFGWTGGVLMAIVSARQWPSRRIVLSWDETGGGFIRMSERRVLWGNWWAVQSLYRDEVPAAEYARVRRELKRSKRNERKKSKKR